MDGKDIALWRMSNLGLLDGRFGTPEEAVRRLCGVQSQDYGPAKWSIAMRTRGIRDEAMDKIFNAGALVRTHVLRPTWHFVLPEDIRWMLKVTGPRVQALNAYMYRREELDETILNKSTKVLSRALGGCNYLTRNEVAEVLDRAGITAGRSRLAYIMMNAELNGTICSGPLRGKQHTYALIDERAPQARTLTFDEALGELTLRYFTGHGPATVKDFKSWSSLTVAEINKGLDMAGPLLEQEHIGGRNYRFSGSPQSPKVTSPTVHLVQGYDEFIMGYSESRHVLDAAEVTKLPRVGRATFNHVVLLDGRLAGHWKRTVKKDSVIIQAALNSPFDAAQDLALQIAADSHGEYLGLSAAPVATMPA